MGSFSIIPHDGLLRDPVHTRPVSPTSSSGISAPPEGVTPGYPLGPHPHAPTHPQKCAEAGVTLTPSACRGGRASLSPSVRILYHSTAFFESRFRVPSCEEITTVPGGLSPSLTLISRLDPAMVCLILFLVILSVASVNVVKTNGRKMSLGKGNR